MFTTIYDELDEDGDGFVVERSDDIVRISYFMDGHFVNDITIPLSKFLEHTLD